MKHPKKVLRKCEKSKSMIKVILDNPCEPNTFKFGTIKGIRKDHFLLDTHSPSSLLPNGKVSAINIKKVARIEKLKSPVCCSQDTKVCATITSLNVPFPVNVSFLGLKMELNLPLIKVSSKHDLNSGQIEDILAKFSGLLAGMGINHTFVQV